MNNNKKVYLGGKWIKRYLKYRRFICISQIKLNDTIYYTCVFPFRLYIFKLSYFYKKNVIEC